MATDVLAYCMHCRAVSDEPRATCASCPDEPLLNVADPDALQMVLDMESAATFRHMTKWQSGMAVAVGLVGGALVTGLFIEYGSLGDGSSTYDDERRGGGGWSLFFPFIACGAAGAGLGGMISRKLRRKPGRPDGVEEAIARFRSR